MRKIFVCLAILSTIFLSSPRTSQAAERRSGGNRGRSGKFCGFGGGKRRVGFMTYDFLRNGDNKLNEGASGDLLRHVESALGIPVPRAWKEFLALFSCDSLTMQ